MEINFNKSGGLVPAIIQDEQTLEVLMLGFMNQEAYHKTCQEGKVSFFSRSRNKLWTKGEESGNFLYVSQIALDCDHDSLLIKVRPQGPTCHTGARNCFSTNYNQNFLFKLEQIVDKRYKNPQPASYVNSLHQKGLNKITQKLGEESIEAIIAALNENEDRFIEESGDLFFHFLVLLREKGVCLKHIAENLEKRHLST